MYFSLSAPFRKFVLRKNGIGLPAKLEGKDSVEELIKRQCATATALILLGLGFDFYSVGEALTVLFFSGAMISLLALALLSAFLTWQGCKRVVTLVGSWKSIEPSCRPAVLARMGSN